MHSLAPVTTSPSLTSSWFPLRYHPTHAKLWHTAINHTHRFIAAVAGRGSGKTEMARRFIVLSLAYKKERPPIYIYCLPTYNQARKVAWYPILNLIPKEWIQQPNGINKSESSITTIFGSTLYIVGMDKPHRVEGLQIDGIVIDESSDQKPELFRKTIMPMLSDRNGWAWRIGVPKKSGQGRVDFRTFFEQGLPESPNYNPSQYSFTWKSEEILTPDQIQEAKRQLDPQEYAEQYEAQWVDTGGTIYFNFSRDNISDSVRYIPGERIYVGCDFNVSPMCWVLGHYVTLSSNDDKVTSASSTTGRLLIFDEIFLKDTNTPAILNHLHEKYGIVHAQSAGEWTFIGDASAKTRKTSATRSDYLTIKNDIRFGSKRILFPDKNPHVRDRIACVNAAFQNALGEKRLLISPRCKHLINDFMVMSYKEATSEPEDYSGTDIGHTADACGYLVFKTMPIKITRTHIPSVVLT